MNAEKCIECGGWAEPPFQTIVCWLVPAIAADAAEHLQREEPEDTIRAVRTTHLSIAKRFGQAKDVEIVRVVRALCRYCAYAQSHGTDRFTEDGEDDLGLSDE